MPDFPALTRREFLAAAAIPLAAFACAETTAPEVGPARLSLGFRARTRGTPLGTDVLYGDALRRAYIRVPDGYDPNVPTPLIILLHGSGGRGDALVEAFGSRTDALGIIALGPDSAGGTWDLIEDGEFSADVPFINDVVAQAYDRCNIDPGRIAILGFSDGASYALTLGLSNGDQLAGIVAHSPGSATVDHPRGAPAFFISHGTEDQILPIEETSRLIVPALQARGCSVTYVEFDGRHEVPDEIADQAMAWLAQRFGQPA
jgi:predicted esterase